MKKMPTVFVRDWEGDRSRVTQEVNPEAAWVLAGEGVPMNKLDGTACMVLVGKLYKRYDAKRGKTPPVDFIPADEPDENTGHWPGWVPVGPNDKWHLSAWGEGDFPDGTYELVGPKIYGNPEGFETHQLISHRDEELLRLPDHFPRTYDSLREYMEGMPIEGIVWHHPDGRMAKLKLSDFGFKRSNG